jgi:hypothetical protein
LRVAPPLAIPGDVLRSAAISGKNRVLLPVPTSAERRSSAGIGYWHPAAEANAAENGVQPVAAFTSSS